MALWFPLKVNDERVGSFYAKRREEQIPADRICTYDVRVTYGAEQKHSVVRHDYDAGAWVLVCKALAEFGTTLRPEGAPK